MRFGQQQQQQHLGMLRKVLGWSSIRSFASTSSLSLAQPPRSIIEWQRELFSPNPSSQVLLSSLYKAIQAPFPPLQKKSSWIEAHDVEATLKLIFLQEDVAGGAKRKDMLDTIMMCMKRCLKDAQRRVAYHLKHDLSRQGIHLTDKEKEKHIARQPTVREWQQILSSKRLLNHHLQLVMKAMRRPFVEDLQEALQAIDGNPTSGLKEYNQLLFFVVRHMPKPDESEKKRRFLDLNPLPRDVQLNILYRSSVEWQAGSLVDLFENQKNDEYDYLLPQDVIRLFEAIWIRICVKDFKPDFISYGTALLLESRLAPWRAIVPHSEQIFEPIHRIMQKIQQKKVLHISHINQLMWTTFRLDPFQDYNEEKWRRRDTDWPGVEQCLQIYQEMRSNAVWIEMEWERRRNGGERRQNIHKPSNIRTRTDVSLLRRSDALPVEILPSQRTYELLIRGLAWRGDMKNAASILHEMTQSNVDTKSRLFKLRRKQMVDYKKEEEMMSPTYAATLATFDSLFRGFCKHSEPSNLVYFDARKPELSQWEPIEVKQETTTDWNIKALIELFEVYLTLNSEICKRAQQGYPLKKTGLPSDYFPLDPDFNDENWFLEPESLELWHSILSLQDPSSDHEQTCRGPTTQQLFNLLTALRRTSNDNATWVLFQWQRVVDKFGDGKNSTKAQMQRMRTSVNKEGWTNWSLDNRLVRILEHLQSRLTKKK